MKLKRTESTTGSEPGIAELCPDGLLIVQDGRIVYANRASCRLLGATHGDEILGRLLSSLLSELSQEEFAVYLSGLRRDRSSSRCVEVQGKSLQGKPVELEVVGALISWKGRRAALLSARDVKERRVTDKILSAAGAELASHVAARTADLARANEALRESVARRDRLVVERNALLKQLALAQEEERRRLSRDLHDQVGQHLTALVLGLEALGTIVARGSDVDRRARKLRKLAASLGRELHTIAVQLRPKTLDDFGLEAALASFVDQWIRQTGIRVDIYMGTASERLPVAIEDSIFRMTQEALTNIVKHSGATRASVEIKRVAGLVHAIIDDNGRGFDASALPPSVSATGGLGLLGMRERAAVLDGQIEIESTPRGTTLFIRIPVKPREPLEDPGQS